MLIPIEHTNPAAIITDADQARLIALDDMLKLSYFAIGDIANGYIDRAPAVQNGVVVTHREIYRAVGYFCGGRSERTIRGYAEIARLFPAEVRAAYDELPFSHFIEARRRGNGWRGYLEAGRANVPLGVKGVSEIVDGETDGPADGVGENPPPSSLGTGLPKNTPPPQNGNEKQFSELFLVVGIISRLIEILGSIPVEALDPPLRRELNSVLTRVLGLLPELRRQLSAADGGREK